MPNSLAANASTLPAMTAAEPPLAGDETAPLLGSPERRRATLLWKLP